MIKVGQRVKKSHGTECVGVTGMVLSLGLFRPVYDCTIRMDAPCITPAGRSIAAGDEVEAFSWQWEPIVPEGQQPAEMSSEELLPFIREKVRIGEES